MKLSITADLVYDLDAPTDMLLQIEVPDHDGQRIADPQIHTTPVDVFRRVAATNDVGERCWIRAEGQFHVTYTSTVTVDRTDAPLEGLPATPLPDLPARAVRYLFPSRLSPADRLASWVRANFGHLSGGARIAAMRDWIAAEFSYVPGSSDAQTTALDTFLERQGVCRDYAHVMIALARASDIPARFASVYAPRVTPQDFHAVAEVHLDGAWHLVDPTGMAHPSEMAVIGVGKDATEVSFLTGFGPMTLVSQTVDVRGST